MIIKYTLPAYIPENNFQTDFARIEKAVINKEITIQKQQEIIDFIKNHQDGAQKISIAWKKYSWWGHTFSDNGIVLDMSHFNEIISYDREKKTIAVESWITWWEIQDFINKDNLSIGVMQSSNIFSVWWSISSNIHGRDPRLWTIIDSIESFRLIWADGTLYNVSESENRELFYSVIGWFGLLWVITDVTLYLTDNENYVESTLKYDYQDYASYIEKNIVWNENIGLHYGRLSIVPGKRFLKDFYITNYTITDVHVDNTLKTESGLFINRFFFNLSRKYDWAKNLRWNLQKIFIDRVDKTQLITRNNAMRPPIDFISYYSEKDTDILHEYFIPIDNYNTFIEHLRGKLIENDINLLNVTTRYVPKDNRVLLNYNTSDMIAIVLYFNVWLSDEKQQQIKNYTQNLIDYIWTLEGTYYLVYQNYSTKEQIRMIYPRFNEFIEVKNKYDPKWLFTNMFFENYK